MEKYYVIWNNDGETRVDDISKEELVKRLNEGGYYGVEAVFLTKIPNLHSHWGKEVLIVKGEIVTPKPVQTVTKYTI